MSKKPYTDACVANLRTAHPQWEDQHLHTTLEVLGRGHHRDVDGLNMPPERIVRHENRHLDAQLPAIGVSRDLAQAVLHTDSDNKPVSRIVLRDTPPTLHEMQKMQAHLDEQRTQREAAYAESPAEQKLSRAISHFMQERATSREAIDEMPALGGRGLVSFLSETDNVKAHKAWLEENLAQFFAPGKMPKLEVKYMGEGSKSKRDRFTQATGLLENEAHITMDTSALTDADLNAENVKHHAVAHLDKPTWGEQMLAHHERRGQPISLQEKAENPLLQTAEEREARRALEASKGTMGGLGGC